MKYYATGAVVGGAVGAAAVGGNDKMPKSDKILAIAGGAAVGAAAVGYGKAVGRAIKTEQQSWEKFEDSFKNDWNRQYGNYGRSKGRRKTGGGGGSYQDQARRTAANSGIDDATNFFGINQKKTTHKKQVKKVYYGWAQKTHPDKFPGVSEIIRKQKEAAFKVGGNHYKNIVDSDFFEKLAYMKYMVKQAAEDQSTYPLTRGYNSLSSWNYYNIPRAINARAMQGRVNAGSPGITEKEKLIMSNMEVTDKDETYPISRAMTNPTSGAIGLGVMGAVLGGKSGPAGALAGAAIGAGAGYGLGFMGRALQARGYVGRARAGREGVLPSDRRVLRQNRGNV